VIGPPEPTAEPNVPFSEDLEAWLAQPGTKTFADLTAVFEEKSFAIALLLLMFTAALPVPTGGITHLFELVTMLLALEMIFGRRTIWLPKRILRRELGPATTEKAIPFIARRVKWFERFARPRFARVLQLRLVLSAVGFVVFLLTVGAFLAPPFTGLDTLPALGVVVIALSLILEDVIVTVIGIAIGAVGVAVEILLGSAVVHLL
jgi:hypothetical protein